MKTVKPQELLLLKEELVELFLTNRIEETKYGWTLDKKRIDIIALHPQNIKYIENLHKSENYRIVFK